MLATEQARLTDTELILRCKRGDRACFRQLYQRYQQRVRSTLYQLCGNSMLDDLVQEVFLRAWKGLPKLREASYFSTWLYRISWNVATDQRRKYAIKQRKEPYGSVEPSKEDYLNSSHHNYESADLMRLHYQDLVKRALQTLSLEHRAVIVLHDLEDLPQKQVAKILQIPTGTVKSRLFHARSAVKKFLIEEGVSL